MIKILKKFHLILAFIVLSISGAIISYHDEIIDIFSKDEVMAGKKPLEIDEILKIFSKSEPNFNLSYLKIRAEANKAYVISGTSENGVKI